MYYTLDIIYLKGDLVMELSIRFVAEYYNTKTGEVIESKVLRKDNVKKPTTIKDLGYLQEEQISLLKSVQDLYPLHITG